MRIACLMMQKNERDLIHPWIVYHAELFGLTNLFVYDNGSTDSETLKILKKYEKFGLNVFYDKSEKRHFENKGEIMSSKIRELDVEGVYDFFLPLDCDEFVGCCIDQRIKIDIAEIEKALHPYQESPEVLTILRAYDNSPVHPDYYLPKDAQRKCFFARNTCASLDIGFHHGKSRLSDKEKKTPIVYFHFHHKSYEAFKKSAYEKLSSRVADFSREALLTHLKERRSGFHLIPGVLKQEEEYNARFELENRVYYPELSQRITELGSQLHVVGETMR